MDIGPTLWGLTHLQGGMIYMGLAFIAGVEYGYVYQQSQRVELTILLHLTVNSIQFLLLTYPIPK